MSQYVRTKGPVATARQVGWLVGGWLMVFAAAAADLEASRREFISGNYSNCIRLGEQVVQDKQPGEGWRRLLAEALVTVGRYPEAYNVISAALDRYPSSIQTRLLGYEVLRQCGQAARADTMLNEIVALANARPYAYRDAPDLVALGRAAMLRGADPRMVLERLFDQARKADPDCREAFLASGDLALEKHDYELAAKLFREGLQRHTNDPDFHCGLARAYAPSDAKEMIKATETALQHNPRHVPSLLLLADHLIDGEEYAGAEEMLAKALAVNPLHPEAWAYRAVLKNLSNDAAGQAEARSKGLQFWKTNPRVDHLIGLKLSRNYRFAEGAASQRLALRMSPDYWPATIQLAQDLLRLGEEHEGWRLAEQVFQNNGYDVVAYNLVTLKDSLSRFQTLTNQDFIVRMSPSEAAIYGHRVLALLDRAKARLAEKYGLQLESPVVVEIFPESKDFMVRTFGMPADTSYLGVCFGRVITANSPASQAAHPSNWEAMLWHEFTHVITLQMTRNKMPRWLSEGISVYEERQANPAWGQRMNGRYREMILGEDLKKIGKLSAAFMSPKTPLDLQFAYYESSLVVEFLVGRFGQERLKKILLQLGQGTNIDRALEENTAPLSQLEKDFAEFAREQARLLGPTLDWKKPPAKLLVEDTSGALEEWSRSHPKNFWVLTQQAKKLLALKQWEAAKVPLRQLIEAYPDSSGPDNAYQLLAEACRGLNETDQERQALSKLASLDADATDAYLRLAEMASSTHDWKAVPPNIERYLAVNPLVAPPYRLMALACESLAQVQPAIQAYQLLLLLDPPNPAEVHFRLARLLDQTGDPEAKRQVLQALEEAPRFREAHRLLLKITRDSKPAGPTAAAPAAKSLTRP